METRLKLSLSRSFKKSFTRLSAIVGISIMFQVGPGSMITSWAIDCSQGTLSEGEYCVKTLNDTDPGAPVPYDQWSLRQAVEHANANGAASPMPSMIGFDPSLFSSSAQTLTLQSSLEIKTNLTIIGPTDNEGNPLLTIKKDSSGSNGFSTSEDPLIAVNPASGNADNNADNNATQVVRLENVSLDGTSTQGTLISVGAATAPSINETQPIPTVQLVNVEAQNASSTTGGSVLSTPGNVQITDSTLTGNSTSGNGGAVSAGGSVTVEGSTLTGNSSNGDGGAISASGNVTVSTSTISDNTANQSGGAIAAGGDVSVSASTVSGNSADNGNGGAISTTGAVSVVASSSVENNTANQSGGAIAAGGDVSVSASTVSGNSADNGNGGAISTTGAVSVVASSSVENNTANQSGGAIAAGGDVSVSASTVSGNSADNGNGGAISTTGAVSVLVSTLSENEANGNGGAIASNSNVTVDETDLISNYANGQGGAIFAEETVVVIASTVERNASGFAGGAIAATDVEVRNGSVISGNSSLGNGGAIHASGTVLISESTLGTAEISNPDYNPIQWIADPVLTNPLASNPFYNVDVPQFLPNPYYSPEITECGRLGLPVVNLPGMGGATGCIISEVENGYSYQLSTTPNPYYNPNLTIPNWQYDDQQFIPNPNYDPNAVIENPDYNPTEFIEIGNTTAMSGGSIFADGEVNIIDSILNGAEAEENGGAVKTNHSVHISGSHIYSNRAYGFGGAIDVADGSTEESTFIDSEIRSNIASSAGAFDGNEGPLTIQNTEFVSNVAITEGGAIWHMGSITIEQGSLFQSNFSVGPLIQTIDSTFSAPEQEDEIWWKNFSAGGAIRINTDELSEEQKENIVMIIRDSEFEYNLALGHGGAISFQGLLYVLRSRFEYNTSFIGDGGAINGTEISIESSVFNNNRALLPENLVNGCYELEGQLQFLCNGYGQGGAIHGTEIEISSDPNSVRSSFQGNISMDDGGAIHVNGHIQVSDTDFILNRTLIGDGGAIDIDSLYDPSIDEYVNFISFFDSTLFSENLSDGDGGAIDGNQGAIVISDSAFEGNQAYDDGGAIWNDGHVSVVDSEFLGNIAEDNGGAIYADTVEIARSRFNSNESENGSGGAVFIHTSSDEPELSVIISSVFEENFASYFGGAVSGSTWIITSSFTNNSAGINGSAIALEGSLGTQLIGSSLIGDDLVDLCSIPFFNSPSSYATDSSCFPLFFEEITGTGASYVLTEDELLEEQYSFSASYFLTENNGYFEMLNNSEAISNLVDYLTGVYEELEQSNDYIEYQGALDELEAELFSIEMRGWELSQIINCWLNEDCDKSELIPLNDALSENISLNDRIEEVTWEITLLNHTVSSLETDSLLLSATNKLFDNSFIEENIGFDVNMTARPSVVNWNVGAVQFLADSSPEDNNFDNNGDNTNGGNDQTDNDPIVVPPSNIDYVIDEDAILKARAQAAELARIEKERYEAELRAAAELAAKKREIRDALKAKRKAELEKRKLATQLLRDKIASRKRNVESDAKTDLPQYLSKRFVNLHSSRPF